MLKAFFNEGFTEIELCDIDIKEHLVNGGYGSILLNRLKQIAEDREARTIRGWITEVDRGHLERLVHFYEKHGFEVMLQDNENSIRIGNLLWLNNLIK